MTPDVFVCTLLSAAAEAHELHLSTSSFSEHEALGKLYEDLPDAVDAVAEVYMGLENARLNFKTEGEEMEAEDACEFVEALQTFVEENREAMGERSAVQNQVDEVLAVIGRARCRLENFK